MISEEDFNRLQNQLIELRTENYELSSKLRKTEADQGSLQEKCSSQEKEIQKLSKIMKFPGFQAITKSKSKKDLAELIEENERLTQQMHRYEDDFKLQNQTLLQEVSRLSTENEELTKRLSAQLGSMEQEAELRRMQAENSVLQKTVKDLQSKDAQTIPSTTSVVNNVHGNKDDFIQGLQETIIKQVKLLIENYMSSEKLQSNIIVDKDVTDSASVKNEQTFLLDLTNSLDNYFNELKTLVSTQCLASSEVSSQSSSESDLKLQTALQETQMLQQRLNSFKEASKKEVQELREEVGKWSEKARKKQESFTKLQEEKEKMYEENRKSQDFLKEEHSKKEEVLSNSIKSLEATIKSLKEQYESNNFQGKLDVIRSENQAMQQELIALKEKHRIDQSDKIKELEGLISNVNTEKENYQQQLKESLSECEEKSLLISTLECNLENSRKQISQATEIAEKRKKMLDDTSVERQKDVENHQNKLEEVKHRYEKEMKTIVDKNNEELEDLKSQISSHKKLKKELDDLKQKNIASEEQLESSEKKAGWLERTLKETEENLETSKSTHVLELKTLEENFIKEKSELVQQLDLKLQESNEQLKISEGKHGEQCMLVEKLKQSAKDREVEYRIANKKTDHLVKDLKRQLNSERKRADQLQIKLQDFIQEIKVKQTYDEIFNPESLQLKMAAGHKRQDSGSHLSLVSSLSGADIDDSARHFKTSSPVENSTNLSGLSDETMDLISRITDLQQEKWMLEERVRHLEENGSAMAEDLMQKSLIIQTYVMENKSDTTPQRRRSLTLKEKMIDKLKLGNEDLSREMNNKMQRMLEETLARNVQLQQDVDLLSKELHSLNSKT